MLRVAIESCLSQSHRDIEILVVDDGPSEASEAVVRAFGHPALRYLRNQGRGAGAARNTGLYAATGSYVKFLDDDDALLPDALAIQLARYGEVENPRDIVTGDWMICDRALDQRSLHRPPRAVREAGVYDLYHAIAFNPITTAPLYPREAALAAGGWDPEMPIIQDFDFAMRILLAGYRYRYFPDPVYRWRVHRNAPRVSHGRAETASAQRAMFERLERRVNATFDGDQHIEAMTALCRNSAKRALRLAFDGDSGEARRLIAFARRSPRPLGSNIGLQMALTVTGLGRLGGILYRAIT